MLVAAWLLFIFVISVVPVPGPRTSLPLDKVVHAVLYGMTAILLFRWFMLRKMAVPKAFMLAFLFSSAYGLAIEIVQYFMPYRQFSAGDVLANSAGAFFFSLAYAGWRK